ncbi:nitrate- and nitrite sensing domain-containing protein [Kitasatospora sp. NPDC059408]|uniref:sensor histidine kinase n=1 Tax=Kitasatospora sp. NPDC059408 TaxID=3346823 RepID=UPI0036B62C72
MLAQKAGQPSNIVYYNLQEERRLSAEALARPGANADQLRRQRQLTDDAVRQFQALSGETADEAPAEVRTAVAEARQALGRLGEQRAAVDRATIDQQSLYAYYTDLIAVDLRLFTALSHVDTGEITWISKTLVNAFWAKEMLAREDAILARGWPSGRLGVAEYQQVQEAIGAQDHLFAVQIAPYVPAAEAPAWHDLMNSPSWQAKTAVEQALTRPTAAEPGGATVKLPPMQDQWRQAVDQVNPQLVKAIETRTDGVVKVGLDSIVSLLTTVVLTAVVGLVAVVGIGIASWRLSRSLRRRIKELQTQAEALERTLPEVVERLGRGEQVDVEAESRAITAAAGTLRGGGTDELATLGQALNAARTSALETAVRQAEQHRGFERLLQRIARRTQLLIGRQLRRLDELERKHEDPEVLEGLFDLDHLTARLRRYEENLVIMAGGQPQRRWRKPVPLLDVLRAAQGEVQDYRRIMLDVEGHPWLSERAVGPVAHVLAELMENATTFSKPPTPVEVRAAMVGRGLAVEIEDRGLGMDPEQYDAANALMLRPPARIDVLERGDDIRLGFHVVARLAANTGLKVEFRPSAFGGTRVVVLVPSELVIDGDAGLPDAAHAPAAAAGPIPLVRRSRKALMTASNEAPEARPVHALSPADSFGVAGGGHAPAGPAGSSGHTEYAGHAEPATGAPAGAAVGAFEPAGRHAAPLAVPDAAPLAAPQGGPSPDPYADQHADPYADPHAAHHPGRRSAQHADQPIEHSSPAPDTALDQAPSHDAPANEAHDAPAYPDIAYALVTDAEAPYADEQYRPADHYRLAERRRRREYASAVPLSPADGHQPPLPQRIRQASLAAELRVPPPPGEQTEPQRPAPAAPVADGQPAGGPFQRPVRRSGATIGAFQRQSRAARAQGLQGGSQDSGETPLPRTATPPVPPTAPAGSPTHAPEPSPWALPAADPRTTRTDDQS